jgi:hypothetical protein
MSKYQEWQNGNFEEYIRQKSEEGQPVDFDHGAWASMEKMLDTHMPVGKGPSDGGLARGGRTAGLIAALLISTLLGWYLATSNNEEEQRQPQKQQQVQPKDTDDRTAVEASETVKTISGATAQQQTATDDQKNVARKSTSPLIADKFEIENNATEAAARQAEYASVELSSGADSPGNMPASSVADAQHHTPATEKAAAQSSAGGSKRNTPAAEQFTRVVPAATAAVVLPVNEGQQNIAHDEQKSATANKAVEQTTSAGLQGAEAQQLLTSLPRIAARPWMPMGLEPATLTPALSVTIAAHMAEEDTGSVVTKQRNALPLSVSITVAPDFTGTGQAGSVKSGAGAGVHLEYFFMKRLSLLSGAFYSKKNYLAGGDFSPYGESWQHGYAPDYVDASCGVIDIPLNLRYYVVQKNRHSFFVSTGASSYLMQREEYYMVYDDYYYDDYTYEVQNENKHFMAVWNLSLGYEHAIAQRWSLQAEPFLKIPLRGVGAGTAKLNSMGLFIHLKYNFMRHAKE